MALADEVFPARVSRKNIGAKPEAKPEGMSIGHWEPNKDEVIIPLGENAYDRTIRVNDALQAIYYPEKSSTTYLGKAIQEAKTHLVYGKDIAGQPRRDELVMAVKDLRNVTRTLEFEQEHGYLPEGVADQILRIATIRAAAVISKPMEDPVLQEKANKLLEKARELFKKKDEAEGKDGGFGAAMTSALGNLGEGKDDLASADLAPYMSKEEAPKGKARTGGEGGNCFGGAAGEYSWFKNPTEIKGQITTSHPTLMTPFDEKRAEQLIKTGKMPRMTLVPMKGREAVPSYVGKVEKAVMWGAKIRAKKLALTVSPVPPKVFTRKLHREGGTILIDGSGSMGMGPEVLREFARRIPLGTIAYYSGRYDSLTEMRRSFTEDGFLVIFAQDGKRSSAEHLVECHHGNYVDLNAMQWLLRQPGPRYMVTDQEFTGPAASISRSVFDNAVARKLIIPAGDMEELQDLLPRMRGESEML